MSEFAFIERIRARLAQNPFSAPDLLLGIGDDTAILRETTGRELLITTDLLVEDIDFKLAYIPPAWLGHKALAVSLSDIAAMGATPRFSLLTLAIPVRSAECGVQKTEFWDAFLEGYCALAAAHRVTLIGGDISGTPERLALDSIVLGHCASGHAVRRSGARVGDAIFVTGALGAAAAGLQLLLNGERVNEAHSDWRQQAIRAHLRPEPRVGFGQQLGAAQWAHAMVDVSDGLAQDLTHLCQASGVSATLWQAALPIAESARQLADKPSTALQLALNGGEDFELLFTAEPSHESALHALATAGELSLSRIGEIIPASTESVLWLLKGDEWQPLQAKGFVHFAV